MQIVVLVIPDQPGGWPLHIILILRLFRMWRVVKFLEVRRLAFLLRMTQPRCRDGLSVCHQSLQIHVRGGQWRLEG